MSVSARQERSRDDGWALRLPPVRVVPAQTVRARLDGARRLVVLDDDPTGTQTVRDVPVLTQWGVDDVRWALGQAGPGFYVLTNTRSLSPKDAAVRNREVAEACLQAAREEGVALSFASRGDSTLRGHFPLETDVLTEVLAAHGHRTDALLLAPAYIDAGRVTLDGVHWTVDGHGLTPVADGEYARDATFGYSASRLADWVEEKSGGRVSAADVTEVGLADVRDPAGVELESALTSASGGRVIVPDVVSDDDMRAVVLHVLEAEAAGTGVLHRVGPSYVRARLGQDDASRIPDEHLSGLVAAGGHGLVVVGSHVGLTSRQLEALRASRPLVEIELDVEQVLDDERCLRHCDQVVATAADALAHELVVVRTSRQLLTGPDGASSLDISQRVSAALVDVTARVVRRQRPSYLVAKGGITSSDVATSALEMHRGWVRGPVLDGIVSLWEAVDGFAAGLAYVVFAGNVGDDQSLADVVDRLETATHGKDTTT